MVYVVGTLLVLLLLAALAGRRRRALSVAPAIRVDEQGIGRSSESVSESVGWAELVQIDIVTTDAGPFADDVFWLFTAQDGSGCALPGDAVGEALFARLGRIQGVDFEAVVRAMGSTENASFRVWSGAPGAASAAAQAAL